MVSLQHSVRAAHDVNFQQIQRISQYTYDIFVNEPHIVEELSSFVGKTPPLFQIGTVHKQCHQQCASTVKKFQRLKPAGNLFPVLREKRTHKIEEKDCQKT